MPILILWGSFLAVWKLWGKGETVPIEKALLLYGGIAILLWHYPRQPRLVSVVVIAVLFAWAAIARGALGENFAGVKTPVRSGPYAIMSHPIYTAIAAAAILTAIEAANWEAAFGAAAITTALVDKGAEENQSLATVGDTA